MGYRISNLSKTEKNGDDLLKCFKENQQEGNLLRDKSMGQLVIEIKSAQVNRVIRRGTGLIAPSTEDLKRFAPAVKSILSSNYFVDLPFGKKFSTVYIPVKDMLTHSSGFLAMANRYRDFPFDKTLTDIVIKASQWKVKQPPQLALAILPILEEMMDGTVVFENDEFYVKKNNGQMILFELVAEGLKKIGLLWQLLMTDNLTKDMKAKKSPDVVSRLFSCQIYDSARFS